MGFILATTWHPRGELPRFHRLIPLLKTLYSAIVIILPPSHILESPEQVEVDKLIGLPDLIIRQAENWSLGRSLALITALDTNCKHIHYADLDRLLHWVETRPEEWREACLTIKDSDCVIMGRTPSAYQTHPNALVRTEEISNRVVSYRLGKTMDVSAGSKGFSRKAVEYIVKNTEPVSAMRTDALWVLSLFRAGFSINYIEVNGLDWESADRYKDRAAIEQDQKREANKYDNKPENWAHRVEIALEIVEAALTVE